MQKNAALYLYGTAAFIWIGSSNTVVTPPQTIPACLRPDWSYHIPPDVQRGVSTSRVKAITYASPAPPPIVPTIFLHRSVALRQPRA